MAASTRTPSTLRMGTWNALRDRPDGKVHGNARQLLRDHGLHALAVQEAADYHDALRGIPGYRLFVKAARGEPGREEQAWLVRQGLDAGRLHAMSMKGDGWTTVTGHHHSADYALAITLAGWLRAVCVHLPPSINWPPPDHQPAGPPERVDDYVNGMQQLLAYRLRRPTATARMEDVRQRGRYGSDHPLVTFTVGERRSAPGGLLYVGDWNCRPGRDEGYATVSWLAEKGHMRVGRARGTGGHLGGVDLPLIAHRIR